MSDHQHFIVVLSHPSEVVMVYTMLLKNDVWKEWGVNIEFVFD